MQIERIVKGSASFRRKESEGEASVHILVIEDNRRLAALLRRLFLEERQMVDLAYDGRTGLALALSDSYDLIILDLRLPDIDGFEICRQLRAEGIEVPLLMLTARGALEDRVKGLKGGADDYLVKPFALEELAARVQALLRRRNRPLESEPRLRVGDLELDLLRHQARRCQHTIDLTAKEFALLEYLMRHPGHVLSRTQILDHVWRYDLEGLSNVVDLYIHYLRDKIDIAGVKPLIKTVRGVGYKIEDVAPYGESKRQREQGKEGKA
jgi:DNA-binding response OmpR family regulator